MQKATSPKPKSFNLYAVASATMIIGGAIAAVLAGVTPSNAASLATKADTQIMVFMIPLTLLVLAMIYEVARFALRGAIPAQAPAPRSVWRYWSPGHNEG